MNHFFKISICLFALVFLYSCNNPNTIQTKLEVDGGLIEGMAKGSLKQYLGIPYAAPPVGELRWSPPQALNSWSGVRDASVNGKICHQPKQPTEFYDRGPDQSTMSEDCLTLNVWTRANTSKEKLPVMVWFHGGALVWGSGSEYSGEELTKQGVILVTVNYRLGPFGFFSHPELSQETGTSGNQGFRDQILSLKWVKENIDKFGGDPDNVTIFGESAGSWSVNVLQASPLSRGLFHKVIGQSGARLIPLTHLNQNAPYSDSAEQLGLNLSKVMTKSSSSDLETLRKLSPIQIIQNIENDPLYTTQFDSLTIIDGEVIPEHISLIYKKGHQADVPVLIGSTADEATSFDPKMLNPGLSSISYKELTVSSIRDILPKADKEIFDLYPVKNEEMAKRSWVDFTTDAMFTAQMQKWGNLMSTVQSPAYLYLWDWYPSVNGSSEYRAFHAAEVPYVFGQFDMFQIDISKRDLDFSQKMIKIWTNFAKTGNPSTQMISWPEFNSSTNEYLSLGESIKVNKNLRIQKTKLINEAYDKARVEFNN
jgi:para-nitrobenzyl esterase